MKKNIDDIEHKNNSIVKELFLMVMHNKKYWMAPVIVLLLIFGLFIVVSGSSFAPFIYALF